MLPEVKEVFLKLKLHPLLHLTQPCSEIKIGTTNKLAIASNKNGMACLAAKKVIEQADKYLGMVQAENKKYNLVSLAAAKEVLQHLGDVWCGAHIFAKQFKKELATGALKMDAKPAGLATSFSASPKIHVIDLGSGAGFPVVPLALLFQDVFFTAVESNNKKANFLLTLAKELQLNNFFVHCGNVNEFFPNFKANFIISRAFANVKKTLKISQHLLNSNGKWLLYKGKLEIINQELENARPLLKKRHASFFPLTHPFLQHQRYLLGIGPTAM